jgi:PIN domain nuclease of toxin-antitoxin system
VSRIVLDASAVLAMLANEPGGEQVFESIDNSLISAVNLSEVAVVLARLGMPDAEAHDHLSALPFDILPFDRQQAFIAASLYSKTKAFGLSFGDRACLALALSGGFSVLTADQAWKKLNLGIKISLIR